MINKTKIKQIKNKFLVMYAPLPGYKCAPWHCVGNGTEIRVSSRELHLYQSQTELKARKTATGDYSRVECPGNKS